MLEMWNVKFYERNYERKSCRGSDTVCKYCGIKGCFERYCNGKQKHMKNNKVVMARQNDKSENYVKRIQLVDLEESDHDGDEDAMVLNVNEDSEKETRKPFYMDGFINEQKLE